MPNWKKVITSGSDAVLNEITSSGGINSTDVNIDGWGSVSASLASIDSDASNLTLQDITNNGNTTTTDITVVGSITGSALQLGNLGAENEILIVGANTQVTSSNLLAIDTVNQRLGIGTSTPEVKLDIVGESSGEAQVKVAQHDNTSDGPDIRFFKSHNTAASPSAVANNDYIGAVNAFAYDGSTYIQSGFFGFQADGTDGDSKFGLRTRVGGTLVDRITIDAAGDVVIGGSLDVSVDISGNDASLSSLNLSSVVNAGTDTDKFLVLDSAGNVDFRTGANVKSDIGLSNVENTALSTWAGSTNITNLGTITTGVWNGTSISDSYISSATSWNAKLDSAGTITNNDYAKFDSNGDLIGRSYSEVKSDLSLNLVENTALSTWAGSTNITTLGTITTGNITAILPSGTISGSITSPSQGTISINGNNIDLGIQSGDSPTFANLTLTGNLTVEGTRTELQVTELNVEDKNITLASGSTTSAAADGAGITIAGANESLTWNHANSRFQFSDDLRVDGLLNIGSVSNAGTDTDKFLVLDSAGNVDYRTGAEVLSDIGGASSALDLDDVTTNGNTTTNSITVGNATIPSGGKLVVGATTSLPYTAHFKSGSDAQMLLETDAPYDGGAGNVAGFRMKVEDTDDDTRAKAGIFYVNTDSNDWGRGELIFSTDGTQDNGNATKDDWKLKIDGLNQGKVSIANALNIGSVPNAGVDTDKFLVLDSAGNVDYRTGAQVLSDIGGLESNGGTLTPLQTYIDFKGLTDGHISFGGVIDPMPLDRWMGVWIAPSDGYIDHIRISPENDNSSTGDVDLQLFVNATSNGSPVTVAMGAAGVNKKFTFGSSYSFSEDDRISIHMNKNGNSSDLYAIQIVYRLNN